MRESDDNPLIYAQNGAYPKQNGFILSTPPRGSPPPPSPQAPQTYLLGTFLFFRLGQITRNIRRPACLAAKMRLACCFGLRRVWVCARLGASISKHAHCISLWMTCSTCFIGPFNDVIGLAELENIIYTGIYIDPFGEPWWKLGIPPPPPPKTTISDNFDPGSQRLVLTPHAVAFND